MPNDGASNPVFIDLSFHVQKSPDRRDRDGFTITVRLQPRTQAKQGRDGVSPPATDLRRLTGRDLRRGDLAFGPIFSPASASLRLWHGVPGGLLRHGVPGGLLRHGVPGELSAWRAGRAMGGGRGGSDEKNNAGGKSKRGRGGWEAESGRGHGGGVTRALRGNGERTARARVSQARRPPTARPQPA